MQNELRATLALWDASSPKRLTHWSQVYVLVLVVLVAVVPVVRVIWMSAISDASIVWLTRTTTPGALMVLAVLAWTAALLVGRERGPALRPTLLAQLLALSAIPRTQAFMGPSVRGITAVAGTGLLVAGFSGAALAARGEILPAQALLLTAVGLSVGVIAGVAWLAGQAAPRMAARGAAVLGSLGTVLAVVHGHWSDGVAWSQAAASPGAVPVLASLLLLTVLATLGVPCLLARVETAQLVAQAARWERSTVYLATLDLGAATAQFREGPRMGRRMKAVRRGPLWQMVLRRDAIGAARSPVRLALGVAACAATFALCSWIFMAPAAASLVAPGWVVGAVSGLVLYLALGPLTQGLQYAATAISVPSPFGVSDGKLLSAHLLFPVVCVVLVGLCAAAIAVGAAAAAAPALVSPGPVLSALLTCGLTGLIALAARLAVALKGPVPTMALTPISSPAGDPGALFLVLWMFDGPLIAAVSGAVLLGMAVNSVGVPGTALWVTAAACLIGAIALCALRWRKRR